MRYQHVASTKARRTDGKLRIETRELIDGIGIELAEHKQDTKESLRELTSGLTDARESLARIEGRHSRRRIALDFTG